MSDAHQADSGSTRVRHCRVSCCDCKPPARSMRRAERTLMPTFAAAPSCSHCFRCSMYLATCVRLMRLPGIATLPRFEECDSSHPQTHPGAQVTGQDSCRRPAKIIVVDQDGLLWSRSSYEGCGDQCRKTSRGAVARTQ